MAGGDGESPEQCE
ncbi:hypothetical protein A2U01_0057035, partial [Trifolium medium]|nr:hypothetical protein [Trifolium medium]